MTARPPRSAQAAREVRRDTPLRRARTCYDHLAGVAGVTLLDGMRRHGWLRRSRPGGRPAFTLTARGVRALGRRGIVLPGVGGSFGPGCLDWTERRPHLGGGLGRAVLAALVSAGLVRRVGALRAVELAEPLRRWLARPAFRRSR